MADKSKMACNKPMKSDRPKKKKMVKACEGGTEKIIHFGLKAILFLILFFRFLFIDTNN